MKMEQVQDSLKHWGEILITTGAGQTYELHQGDTQFDFERRTIKLTSPQAEFLIDGDDVAVIKMHYGHRAEGH